MYIAIYRWKLKAGTEEAFEKLWAEGTMLFRNEQKAWGSRLHRGDDGTHFAYAQWRDRELYHAKKNLTPHHLENLKKMGECVQESFPVTLGEVTRDLLIHDARGAAGSP